MHTLAYTVPYTFYGGDYETIDRTLATHGICRDLTRRHALAFSVRMAGGCSMDRALLGGE